MVGARGFEYLPNLATSRNYDIITTSDFSCNFEATSFSIMHFSGKKDTEEEAQGDNH